MRDNHPATLAEITALIRKCTGWSGTTAADDALLDLWRQYRENEAHQWPQDEHAPDYEARYEAEATRYSNRWRELVDAITATPATSPAGLRIKLELLQQHIGEDPENRPIVDAVLADFDRIASIDGDLSGLR